MTETRLSGLLIKTGSIPTDAIENFSGNVTASLPTGTVSSSTQVTALLPGGAISSSTQVNYTQLQNIPSGIASSSAQVTAYLPTGVASSSAQIKEYLPSDTVSSSIQIKAFLPDGTVSSSTQLPDGIASSSAQIKEYLPTGTVSSSGQVSYLGLSNIPSGIASSSAQVTDYLPTGTVSQSSQIIVQNTTGIGALATTGSNTFNGSQTITGNLTVNQNFTVLGSASIQYVSQSTLNIASNIITVNTNTPAVNLGGIAVIDSGSSPQRSGSLLFDSVNDQWIFVHQNTAGGVTSSVVLMGPPTFNNVGSETLLTQNRLIKGNGLEHVVSSIITDDGTNVGIGSASPSTKLDVSGNTKTSAVLLPGSTSGTVTLQAAATAGTTTITFPATTGTVVTTGDTSTVTNTMLAGSIANNKLTNSTISGISLGSNLATLTIGSGLTGTSYNGSTAVTISISNGAITNAMLANSTISGISLGSNLATLTMNVSGTGLSGNTTYNGSGATTFTVTSNATSANTANAIVARDGSGNFNAGTITATLSGNATSATTAGSITSQANSATITATSANTGNQIVLRDASGNFTAGTITATLSGNATSATTAGSITSQANSATITATSANTANQIVLRDGSGNFSAGTITAALSGTATTATNWGAYGAVPAAGTSFGNANTIGRSDANGYTFFGYINSSTSNSENPSVSQVIVTNGSDNYYRKASIAHLTSAVQSNASGNWSINVTGNAATATSATTAGSITSQANSATITAATAATANTIVLRDGSGHITGAYIFGSYFNASAGNSENPTIGQIWTQNTSDNYLRKSTPAHLISQLGLLTTSNYNSYAMAGAGYSANQNLNTASSPTFNNIYANQWFRNNGSALGLYNEATGNHWYSDSNFWNVAYAGNVGIRLRNGYAGTILGYLYAEISGRSGLLSNDGSWAVSIAPSVGGKYVLIGGTYDNNAYNSTSGIRLLLGGGDGDAIGNYYIGTNLENYGGNYNKLDLRWHTGIRMGAQPSYGGVRIFDSEDVGTRLFSVGETDTHVRVTNTMYAGGDVVAYSSDARLKENIKPIDNPIEKIMKLNGIYYTWKDMVTEVGFNPSQKEEVGVLAQEVQEVLPEVVTLAPFDEALDPHNKIRYSKSGENYLTVKYDKLIPLLIEAIKEQQVTIQQLHARIETLETK